MTSFHYWRTCARVSPRSWNNMLRLTITTRSKQLWAMKASTILMPTTCMMEPCIEWCLTSCGCASTRTDDGEDQSRSDQMGEVTQHIRQVWILHRVWYRSTHTTQWQVQWLAILPRTEGRHVFRWNQEIYWEEWYHRQSKRDEYTKTHMWSCTSSKVSCTLFTSSTGHSTGISCHSHS